MERSNRSENLARFAWMKERNPEICARESKES
jgi:hypothetical protein